MKSLVILGVASTLMAAAGEPSRSFSQPPMPLCAELASSPTELIAYLEKDAKSRSAECTEFAIRQLAASPDQISLADSERAINAVLPFLNFRSRMGGFRWYPARLTIAGVTNNAIQRLEDDHQDASLLRQRVVDRLIASISNTSLVIFRCAAPLRLSTRLWPFRKPRMARCRRSWCWQKRLVRVMTLPHQSDYGMQPGRWRVPVKAANSNAGATPH